MRMTFQSFLKNFWDAWREVLHLKKLDLALQRCPVGPPIPCPGHGRLPEKRHGSLASYGSSPAWKDSYTTNKLTWQLFGQSKQKSSKLRMCSWWHYCLCFCMDLFSFHVLFLKLLVFQYSTLISFRFLSQEKSPFPAFFWPDPPAAWGLPNLKGLLQIQVGDSIPQLEGFRMSQARGWFGGTKKSKESKKPNKLRMWFSRFIFTIFHDFRPFSQRPKKKTKPTTNLSNQSGCMWRPIKYSADR